MKIELKDNHKTIIDVDKMVECYSSSSGRHLEVTFDYNVKRYYIYGTTQELEADIQLIKEKSQ